MNLSLPFFDTPLEGPPPDAAPAALRPAASAWAPIPTQVQVQAGPAWGDQAGLSPGLDVDTASLDALTTSSLEAPLDAVARASRLAQLHPSLWRASQVGGAAQRTTASGFEALDAQLPGGGWPHGILTELLLAQPGVGEIRLLAPALAARADEGRCVMLFDPPAGLSAWALVQCGLSSQHWLVVHARAGTGRVGAGADAALHRAPRSASRLSPLLPSADLLWALEQALKSGHVGAILAWLPLHLRADALRRLQMAAQTHDGPVFVFRDAQARSKPSPAPLRLLLQPAGVDGLSVRLLKRRGPPLAQPLRLVLPSVLTPRQQAQAQQRDLTRQAARAAMAAVPRAVPVR